MKSSLVAAALLGGATAHSHRRGHEMFHKRANDTEVCVPGCTTIYSTVTGGEFVWQPTPNAPPANPPSSAATTQATSVPVPGPNSAPPPSAPAPSAPAPSAPGASSPAPSAPGAPSPAPSAPAASSPAPPAPAASSPAPSAPAPSSPAVVPTPQAYTNLTPGTTTFPASTLTVSETTSVVVPVTTTVPVGTHTLGGVTTVVETATTVVCPYASASTQSGGVVTNVIQTTTYVCPAAGTYTIAPVTVTVTAPTQAVTVPVVSTFLPGTYTAPAVTTLISTETVVFCPFASSGSPAPTTTSAAVPVTSTATVSSTSTSVVEAVSSVTSVIAPPPSAAAPTSSIPAAASSVPVPASSPVGQASSSVVVGSSASTTLIPIPSSVIPVASSAVHSSTSSSAKPSSTGSLGGGSGNQWAITYTPYDSATGACKTKDVVDADVKSIAASGFKVLRVYSTDCDTLPNVGAACEKYSVRMITGIFISEVGCANASPDVNSQIAALKAWGRFDLVDLIAVGNEALYNGYCTPQELVALITHVKSELSGYTGKYTTTDIVSAWQKEEVQSVVCEAVDVVAANVHSYFSADTPPKDAGKFVKSQIEIVEQACSGKSGFVLECGYPTGGNPNGVNVPSVENQKTAITSILETIGEKVVFFSMFNDEWKQPGTCNCERTWGVGDLFGALGEGNNE